MDESTGGGSGGAGSPARLTIVDTWLEPLPGAACGENLEYDDEFREMEKAAAGKPAGQFDPEGVPPDWRAVLGHTQSLLLTKGGLSSIGGKLFCIGRTH